MNGGSGFLQGGRLRGAGNTLSPGLARPEELGTQAGPFQAGVPPAPAAPPAGRLEKVPARLPDGPRCLG